MSTPEIVPIEIPNATLEPAAYVKALVETLGERDPIEVYASTAAVATELCAGLNAGQWRIPLADSEWTAAQIIGHLFDVDIVYGFRWRMILTEDVPSYPGYDENRWSELARPQPETLVAALVGLRAANLALLREIRPDELRREGVHGEQGAERFDLTVRKIAGHDLAHLNQLARTVAVARG